MSVTDTISHICVSYLLIYQLIKISDNHFWNISSHSCSNSEIWESQMMHSVSRLSLLLVVTSKLPLTWYLKDYKPTCPTPVSELHVFWISEQRTESSLLFTQVVLFKIVILLTFVECSIGRSQCYSCSRSSTGYLLPGWMYDDTEYYLHFVKKITERSLGKSPKLLWLGKVWVVRHFYLWLFWKYAYYL